MKMLASAKTVRGAHTAGELKGLRRAGRYLRKAGLAMIGKPDGLDAELFAMVLRLGHQDPLEHPVYLLRYPVNLISVGWWLHLASG